VSGYATIRGDVLDYDPRVEALSSDAYRLFLLTLYSRGRTMLGVMRFVPADVVPRVRAWDEATAKAALAELEGVGLVTYDPQARLLYNPLALEFSPIRSANQVRGGCAALADLPDSPVMLPAARVLLASAEALDPATNRDRAELVATIEARVAALERLAAGPPNTPGHGMPMGIDTPGEPMATPCAPHAQGYAMGIDTPGHGVGMGSQAGDGQTTTSCGGESSATTWPPHAHGYAMGIDTPGDGVDPRARARPDPSPNPNPKPEEPPQPPLAAQAGQGRGKTKSAEGGKYAGLDQHARVHG